MTAAMPQLAFDTFLPQIVWLLLILLLFYVMLRVTFLPLVRGSLETRAAFLEKTLQEFHQKKNEADQVLSMCADTEKAAGIRANELLMRMRQEIAADMSNSTHLLNIQLQKDCDNALQNISEQKEVAMKNMHEAVDSIFLVFMRSPKIVAITPNGY